jgi:hypothetical protein
MRTERLVRLIQRNLTDDLLSTAWGRLRDPGNPLSGHCYIAAEALWHLIGGPQSGFVPHVLSSRLWPEGLNPGETHWFLRRVKGRGRKILDPTARQFNVPIAYDRGRGNGFLTTAPSKRAKILIERVLTLA